MAVYNDDFFAAVAGHFVGGCLQKFHLNFGGIRDSSGLVASLRNLAKIIGRKDHGVFLLGCLQGCIPDVNEIRADGKLGAVFLQNAKGEKADALRLMDGLNKVRAGELFPFGRKCGGVCGLGLISGLGPSVFAGHQDER